MGESKPGGGHSFCKAGRLYPPLPDTPATGFARPGLSLTPFISLIFLEQVLGAKSLSSAPPLGCPSGFSSITASNTEHLVSSISQVMVTLPPGAQAKSLESFMLPLSLSPTSTRKPFTHSPSNLP